MLQKYKKITTQILYIALVLLALLFADSWLLPQKTIKDEIEYYSTIYSTHRSKYSASESKTLMGYVFLTKNKLKFSTQETFIKENDIIIEQSYLLKNITSVKTQTKDYSEKLMSGFSGLNLYLAVGLLISIVISLLSLKFDKNLTENGFQNIIIFNSFLVIIALYLGMIYN
ncbi:hypothetical protein [Flavobacterium sp.]|uniref:hypothetical protein n=1 Tax=Flavobacterium sp. TaxID=239 RepID=UPI002631B3C3|nr:hypothetical protein [Flavobacterium sp.]